MINNICTTNKNKAISWYRKLGKRGIDIMSLELENETIYFINYFTLPIDNH